MCVVGMVRSFIRSYFDCAMLLFLFDTRELKLNHTDDGKSSEIFRQQAAHARRMQMLCNVSERVNTDTNGANM